MTGLRVVPTSLLLAHNVFLPHNLTWRINPLLAHTVAQTRLCRTCTFAPWSKETSYHREFTWYAEGTTMGGLSALGKGIWYVESGIRPSSLSFRVFLLTLPYPLVADTEILHVEIPGVSIISLNTQEAAIELLDRRSRFYSSMWVYFVSPLECIDYTLLYLSDQISQC